MQEGTEANNKLGADLGNEANQFLQVKKDLYFFPLLPFHPSSLTGF
jgi:hypothetical protein